MQPSNKHHIAMYNVIYLGIWIIYFWLGKYFNESLYIMI